MEENGNKNKRYAEAALAGFLVLVLAFLVIGKFGTAPKLAEKIPAPELLTVSVENAEPLPLSEGEVSEGQRGSKLGILEGAVPPELLEGQLGSIKIAQRDGEETVPQDNSFNNQNGTTLTITFTPASSNGQLICEYPAEIKETGKKYLINACTKTVIDAAGNEAGVVSVEDGKVLAEIILHQDALPGDYTLALRSQEDGRMSEEVTRSFQLVRDGDQVQAEKQRAKQDKADRAASQELRKIMGKPFLQRLILGIKFAFKNLFINWIGGLFSAASDSGGVQQGGAPEI